MHFIQAGHYESERHQHEKNDFCIAYIYNVIVLWLFCYGSKNT